MNHLISQHTETPSNPCVVLSSLGTTTNQEIAILSASGSTSMPKRFRMVPKCSLPELLLMGSPDSITANLRFPCERVWVHALGEKGYYVLRPFLIRITRFGAGNFEASFPEANIAIGGISSDDAYQALVANILDTLDSLMEERSLVPMAVQQLQTLCEYIVKEDE